MWLTATATSPTTTSPSCCCWLTLPQIIHFNPTVCLDLLSLFEFMASLEGEDEDGEGGGAEQQFLQNKCPQLKWTNNSSKFFWFVIFLSQHAQQTSVRIPACCCMFVTDSGIPPTKKFFALERVSHKITILFVVKSRESLVLG